METKKIITDEVIEKRLKDRGLSMYDNDENALEKLQNYYDFELTDSYNKAPDYSRYEESTADGYEVWVATHGDGRDVCVGEDIHYYDNELADKLYQPNDARWKPNRAFFFCPKGQAAQVCGHLCSPDQITHQDVQNG